MDFTTKYDSHNHNYTIQLKGGNGVVLSLVGKETAKFLNKLFSDLMGKKIITDVIPNDIIQTSDVDRPCKFASNGFTCPLPAGFQLHHSQVEIGS